MDLKQNQESRPAADVTRASMPVESSEALKPLQAARRASDPPAQKAPLAQQTSAPLSRKARRRARQMAFMEECAEADRLKREQEKREAEKKRIQEEADARKTRRVTNAWLALGICWSAAYAAMSVFDYVHVLPNSLNSVSPVGFASRLAFFATFSVALWAAAHVIDKQD